MHSPQDHVLFQASSHVPKPTAGMPALVVLYCSVPHSHATPQKGHRMYGTITKSVPMAPVETKVISFCGTRTQRQPNTQ